MSFKITTPFDPLFETVQAAALRIDALIREGELGYSDHANATGDTQLKLDIASDAIIEETFRSLTQVHTLISEEKEHPLPLHDDGRYTVCYDPLDGSSIVDVDLSVGSIYGFYDGEPRGESLAAAAYVIYGPRIELVTTTRETVPQRYRYIGTRWEWLGALQLGPRGKLVAPGGTQRHWFPQHKAFVEALFGNGYRLRYSGGMAPDLHQILVKGGGFFGYPGTTDKPEGKLRQLFEVMPYALMFETAGGQAIDDQGQRLLERVPRHIHDTTPCFFGSQEEIDELKRAYGL
jgi:fructose-1,6-bisphosphatase I